MHNQRQIYLLLVLATLGVALLLYRLAAVGARSPRAVPTRGYPVHDRKPTLKHGRQVWTQRVVAVGDLHGDLPNAQRVLRMSGVIDEQAAWIGGETTLVQTGDIVDRGTDTIALYKMMQSLRSQASSQGGRVVSVLGNHEMMNALGDWRYVTQEDIKTFGSIRARQDALSEDGWLGQEWIANYTVTAKVPISPYDSPSHYLAFSHGSLSPSLSILTPFPNRPNSIGHSLLTKALTKPMPLPYPPNPYPGMPRGVEEDEQTLYGQEGVLWWRGLATEDDEGKVCKWAGELKEKLGVRRMIGGHTPNFEKIVHRCMGDVIIIDTGISKAYGGVLSALEITYDLYEAPSFKDLSVENQRQEVMELEKERTIREFVEVETVVALYPKGRVELDRREGVVKFDTSRPAVVY